MFPLAVFCSAEMEAVIADSPQAKANQYQQQAGKDQIALPQPRQPVVAEVMHVISSLIQRRYPAYPDSGFVSQFCGQLK